MGQEEHNYLPGGLDLQFRTLRKYFPRKLSLLMFLGEGGGEGVCGHKIGWHIESCSRCLSLPVAKSTPTSTPASPRQILYREDLCPVAPCLGHTGCFYFHRSLISLENSTPRDPGHTDSRRVENARLPAQRAACSAHHGTTEETALSSWYQAPGTFPSGSSTLPAASSLVRPGPPGSRRRLG